MDEKRHIKIKWKAIGPSLIWIDGENGASVRHRDDSDYPVEGEGDWCWFASIAKEYFRGASATLDAAVEEAEQAIRDTLNSESYQRNQERRHSASNAIADFLQKHEG